MCLQAYMEKGTLVDNRYRLNKFIGSGSFGEVWLAEDTALDNMSVAVKIYISLDSNGQQEFSEEYKVAYGMNHQNLLKADYYSIWEHHPYLVMKYCSNGSTSRQLGMYEESQVWHFIRDVASGLAYLHSQNPPIIHQDIKPDNILIDEHGNFLITDFGISRKMRSTMRKQSKRVVGSGALSYMGPERFLSNPIAVKASDIWSLGASIYEICTSCLPFAGHGGGMLNNGAEMPQLDTMRWSENLNDVMQRCLAKETWDRPTAQELSEYAALMMKGKDISFESFRNKDQEQSAGFGTSTGFSTDVSNTSDAGYVPPMPPATSGGKKKNKWLVPLFCFLGTAIVVFLALFFIGLNSDDNTGGGTDSGMEQEYKKLTLICENNINMGSAENYTTLLEAGLILDSLKEYERINPNLKELAESKTTSLETRYQEKSAAAAGQWRESGNVQLREVDDKGAALQYYQIAALLDPSDANKHKVAELAKSSGCLGAEMAVRDAKIVDDTLLVNYMGVNSEVSNNVPVDYTLTYGDREEKGHADVTVRPGKGQVLRIKLDKSSVKPSFVVLSSGGIDFFSQELN